MAHADFTLAEMGCQLLRASRDEACRVRLAASDVSLIVGSNSIEAVQELTQAFAPYLNAVDYTDAKRAAEATDKAYVIVGTRLPSGVAAITSSLGLDPISGHGAHSGWHVVRKQIDSEGRRHVGHALWHQGAPETTYVLIEEAGRVDLTLLRRMVRAIAARRLVEAGWMPLHAACVVTKAGAVCLTGRRGGGKTTAALAALEAGAEFMANDRVFIAARSPEGYTARALPFSVGVRAPTMSFFPFLPRLADEIPDLTFESGANAAASFVKERRIFLQPRRLSETFHTHIVPAAPVRCIVRINHRRRQQSTRYRAHGLSAARGSLQEAHLSGLLPDDEYELARVEVDLPRLRALHDELLDNVARRVPATLFEPGPPRSKGFRRALASILEP